MERTCNKVKYIYISKTTLNVNINKQKLQSINMRKNKK